MVRALIIVGVLTLSACGWSVSADLGPDLHPKGAIIHWTTSF